MNHNGCSSVEGLNRTSVGLKHCGNSFLPPRIRMPQSNQRGIETPNQEGFVGCGRRWPQSNQRGIETRGCSGDPPGSPRLNRTSVGLKHDRDKHNHYLLDRLNRTSVGLKPKPSRSNKITHSMPQSNQRGIETLRVYLGGGYRATRLNRTSVGLKPDPSASR